jgi:uncharacterized protein YggE
MNYLFAIILAATTILAALPAAAQDIDRREHIDVIGSAEIKVVPNEFVLRSTVESFDKSLTSASKRNDALVAKIFKEITRLGVARKYVVTSEVSVNAVTEGYRERGNFRRLGYNVTRDIMVVLHDAKRIEPSMKRLFSVGVDRLTMSTSHTDIASLTENAQIAAATAATKKGKLLSSALGRRLGTAVSISEDAPHRGAPQNFVYTSNTPDLGDTMSLSKIRVQSSVRVKFLLN